MTHNDFLDNLRAWREADERKRIAEETDDPMPPWGIAEGNEVRCGRFCPITYMVKKETGLDYDVGDWEHAAAEIELDEPIDVVNAADLIPGHDPGMRDELLESVGIDKKDDWGDAGIYIPGMEGRRDPDARHDG